MQQSVTILGSTGSIGCNTIKVIEQHADKFRIEALTANSNVKLLAHQAKQLNAKSAVIADKNLYNDLKNALSGTNIEARAGEDEITNAASQPSDIVMSAIVGAAGLTPTMAAIKRGAKIALANKECLVCAGSLMMDEVKKSGATLIPVDSEHNAIFQIFDFDQPNNISKIILTASGGPFRGMNKQQMTNVTPEQAISHPNWNMGNKISIDSATMMNKGLEIIEAYHLFPIEKDQIDVIIHPESIIHSMVEYIDGGSLAQLGTPDMCTPISIALSWPNRNKIEGQKLDLTQISQLNFSPVDHKNFPATSLAKDALKTGGAAPIIFNTANEIAVEQFLKGKISFLNITENVKKALDNNNFPAPKSIDDVLQIIKESGKAATLTPNI